MNAIYLAAAKQAEKVRIKLSYKSLQPVNIFDICEQLGVTVRFLDISMEGMYFSLADGKNPTIVISSLRPFPRRVYTCGHELGHHLFGHGSKIDSIDEDPSSSAAYNDEERLVDTFAGLLLMPVAAVETEFRRRGWDMGIASQEQFYIISSLFGVGYQTLVSHCKFNKLINERKALGLLKAKPAKLFQSFCNVPLPVAPFKVIDGKTQLNTIDIEVGNYIILPADTICEGTLLEQVAEVEMGKVFKAIQPGINRIYSEASDLGSFIRIQNTNYVGLAENRHLENDLD